MYISRIHPSVWVNLLLFAVPSDNLAYWSQVSSQCILQLQSAGLAATLVGSGRAPEKVLMQSGHPFLDLDFGPIWVLFEFLVLVYVGFLVIDYNEAFPLFNVRGRGIQI